MKKILSILVSAILISFTTGCSDYLDIKPRGTDVPQKLSHYEGLLYGADLTGLWIYHYGTFEHTIDADGFSSLYIYERYNAAKAYQWQADIFRADDKCSEWNDPCTRLYTLNVVVNDVMDAEDGTESQKIAVRSEARFMRAWSTYLMAQFFGKPYDPATAATDLCVPIITKSSTVGNDFSRRTVKEVYDYILTEMTESLPYLPNRPAHPKRVFNAAGNAMLGKVYWMMGNYKEALPYLEAAKSILDSDGNKKLINFNDIIDKESGEILDYPNLNVSPENVYEIPGMPNLWTALAPLIVGSPLRTLRADIMKDYFDASDYRLALFSGVETWMTAYADFDPQVRFYTNMTNMVSNDGITVPDVYLMYAECLAREGKLSEAQQVTTEFRSKRMPAENANIPTSISSKDDLVKFIVAERIREQFGTGITWFDMRRLWNDPLFQNMKNYYTRTDGTNTYTLTQERLTLRIPPSVMVWNKDYVQNE